MNRARSILWLLTAIAACVLVVALYVTGEFERFRRGLPERAALVDLDAAQLRPVPEYERSLSRVAIALAGNDSSLALHDELLRALPTYSQVEVLVPEERLESVRASATGAPYEDRLRLHAYERVAPAGSSFFLLMADSESLIRHVPRDAETGAQHGTRWAQDLFEVLETEDGEVVAAATWIQRQLHGPADAKLRQLVADTAFLDDEPIDELPVDVMPVAFNGGNVMVDTLAGERIALVGVDAIRKTETLWRMYRRRGGRQARIVETLAQRLGVDRVVVLGGKGPQPDLMYHLDQAVLPLGDGKIAVVKINDEQGPPSGTRELIEQVEDFLRGTRVVLKELGYEIVDLEISPIELTRYQHTINAIPYRDLDSGERKLMIPVFAEGQQESLALKRNVAVLESQGYDVIRVPTRANDLKGGIHCLVNVLR